MSQSYNVLSYSHIHNFYKKCPKNMVVDAFDLNKRLWTIVLLLCFTNRAVDKKETIYHPRSIFLFDVSFHRNNVTLILHLKFSSLFNPFHSFSLAFYFSHVRITLVVLKWIFTNSTKVLYSKNKLYFFKLVL